MSALVSFGRFGDGRTQGSPVSSNHIERRQPDDGNDVQRRVRSPSTSL